MTTRTALLNRHNAAAEGCRLIPVDTTNLIPPGSNRSQMDAWNRDHHTYLHEGDRILIVTVGITTYPVDEAFRFYMGITRWRTASVGVQGSLSARLADQVALGRIREPGERSGAPLPDWYDLTHVAYVHAAAIGFDPRQPIWQVLPSAEMGFINIAETLHLRQPT